ncbi:MAG: macro domain-containing protein [Clostridiales bacterium]|nr:macro domain-containing protein [Clostridiales bacterium]
MPLGIIRNDITKLNVDAIVNAANNELQMGGGVCGAIFNSAGEHDLQVECNGIGYCEVGQAVITRGYRLPAKHIIHTVGPVWYGGNNNELQLLSNCYTNSLLLAEKNHLQSIAFPLISSGIFGYPKDKALKAATSAIGDYLLNHDMMVYLVVYDSDSFVISEKLYNSVTKYIDDNYIEEKESKAMYKQMLNIDIHEEKKEYSEEIRRSKKDITEILLARSKRNIEDVVEQLEDTFSERLLRLIDEKEMDDVKTYKRANKDRKLFSKIRSNKFYKPSKNTAIAFAIALQLSFDETNDLLETAGYILSRSSRFDLIVEYCIKNEIFNIHEVNETLYALEEKTL